MNNRYRICIAVFCALAALLTITAGALAQYVPPPSMAIFGGNYIRLDIGDFYYYDTTDPTKPDTPTYRVLHGSYRISTQEGDPETDADNIRPILYGYWKMKVGNTVLVVGDSATGSWTKAPTVYLFPQPGLGLGKTGGYMDAEWTTKEIPNGDVTTTGVVVKMNLRMWIVRDQVRFEATVTNLAKTPQSIGVEVQGAALLSDTWVVAYPFIPGRGISRYAGVPERPIGSLMSGSAIPPYIDIFDDMEDPAIVPRLTLSLEDATRPDYFAIGDHYEDFYLDKTWIPDDFVPDPGRPLDTTAYIACWAPKVQYPNGIRKVVTYAGCGAASSRWTTKLGKNIVRDSAVLAVEAPRAFRYDENADTNDINPSTIKIKAYVNNLATDPGPYQLNNVTAALYLPKGLVLDAASTARQTIGNIPINSESLPVEWTVKPTGFYSGELEYYVSVSDAKGWQQTVARKVMVPATKKTMLRAGWQLISVPFNSNNPDVANVFGSSLKTIYWDPVQSPLMNNSYLPMTNVQPGKAFWLYADTASAGPCPIDASAYIAGESVGKQLSDQYVETQTNWNMIGNPFVYPVYWGQVQVYHKVSGITVTLDQAVANKWISKTLFAWNPDKNNYDIIKTNDALLSPWKGYWFRAFQPVTLVFRPSVFPETDTTAKIGGY